MCDHSWPWLAKDLLRDGIAHKFLDMGFSQPDLRSKFREGGFTANGKGMGKTKTRHSVQADLSGCQSLTWSVKDRVIEIIPYEKLSLWERGWEDSPESFPTSRIVLACESGTHDSHSKLNIRNIGRIHIIAGEMFAWAKHQLAEFLCVVDHLLAGVQDSRLTLRNYHVW